MSQKPDLPKNATIEQVLHYALKRYNNNMTTATSFVRGWASAGSKMKETK